MKLDPIQADANHFYWHSPWQVTEKPWFSFTLLLVLIDYLKQASTKLGHCRQPHLIYLLNFICLGYIS